MKIAIHSVFIAKENILFLEEWIDYHIQLGVDYFYLYDNSNVEKVVGFNAPKKFMIAGKINKYNIDFDKIVNMTNEEVNNVLLNIQSKYKCVNIIEWSPKDKDGKIVHFQQKAHADCLNRLKETNVDWCVSIDIDEFIVLKDKGLKEYINSLDPLIYGFMISQYRFDRRFNNLNKLVTQVNKTSEITHDISHSPKYIYNVQKTDTVSIHSCNGKGNILKTNLDGIWFNHYNTDFSNPETKYKELKNMNPDILSVIEKNSKNYILKHYE